ncbi:MAG: MaoC/PaaZ C-terminal domain-containing protein, partial [Paraglaciecola sp.]
MLESKPTLYLSSFPSLKYLLGRLTFSFAKKLKEGNIPNSLPRLEYIIDDVRPDQDKLAIFNNVTHWNFNEDLVHPCFLYTTAFPLQIALMLLPDFPFPIFGLIHIRNKITQYRSIRLNERLQFRCKFAELNRHLKGWEFSIKVRVYSGPELVWESLSTNLYISNKTNYSNNHITSSLESLSYGALQLKSNIGRKYARCSGDYNLIHLNKWFAKLFGFKVHIAHGMWSKSWCISTLHLKHPSFFERAFSV